MKIGIIGVGRVGATIAYTLGQHQLADTLLLCEAHPERLKAEVIDLSDGLYFSKTTVMAAQYEDLAEAKIVIFTCGIARALHETRDDLLEKNKALFETIVPAIAPHTPHATFIVVTNPVDQMAQITRDLVQGTPIRVLSSGTLLDAIRLSQFLDHYFGLPKGSCSIQVAGEHGDRQRPLWNTLSITGSLSPDVQQKYQNLVHSTQEQQQILDQVRYISSEIITGKGATFFGIANAVTRICQDIIASS